MSELTNANDRTETKRFETEIDETPIVGDRIDPQLVATTPGQYGQRVSAVPEGPKTQLVAISIIDRMQDVYSALLADPETGRLFRAGRHDSQQAWNQKEADWKVYDAGTRVRVEDVHELTLASNDNPVDDDADYIQGWVDIVIGDLANGHFDYSDEVSMNGRTLILSDIECRKAIATISLEE